MKDSLNGIYDALVHDANMTQQKLESLLQDTQESFENTKVDVCGTPVSTQFIREYVSEIEENKEIWKEILDRNMENHRNLTLLIDSVAESLSKHKGELILDGLTALTDASVESLSKHKGRLCLDGLTILTDAEV